MATIWRVEMSELEELMAQYEEGSPYYESLAQGYGEHIWPATAQRIARQHGIALESLTNDGSVTIREGKVTLVELVIALGY